MCLNSVLSQCQLPPDSFPRHQLPPDQLPMRSTQNTLTNKTIDKFVWSPQFGVYLLISNQLGYKLSILKFFKKCAYLLGHTSKEAALFWLRTEEIFPVFFFFARECQPFRWLLVLLIKYIGHSSRCNYHKMLNETIDPVWIFMSESLPHDIIIVNVILQ